MGETIHEIRRTGKNDIRRRLKEPQTEPEPRYLTPYMCDTTIDRTLSSNLILASLSTQQAQVSQ